MRETEPKTITQGETLNWSREFPDYSPAEWSLVYYFRGVGKGLDASATTDGNIFVVTVPSTETLQLAVGRYSWQAWLTKGAEKKLAGEGVVKVNQGLTTIGAGQSFDDRTQAEKDLEAVRAMISGKAAKDVQEYAIGNRQLKHIPIADLIALEKNLIARVNQERMTARRRRGGKLVKTHLIRHRDR